MRNSNIKRVKEKLSFLEIFKNDSNNISNHFNTHRYREVIEGNVKSPSLEMLLNYGKFNLSDLKTLDYFNKNNLALDELRIGMWGEVANDKCIKIDKKLSRHVNLNTILSHRKSYRNYSSILLANSSFKKCLYPLLSMNHKDSKLNIHHRAYASGGALYPIKTYILVQNVRGIEKGWYLLQPFSKTLRPIVKDEETLFNNGFQEAAFIIFYTYSFLSLIQSMENLQQRWL